MYIIRCGEQKSFQVWSERRRRGAKILSHRGRNDERFGARRVRPEFGCEIEMRDSRAVILVFYPGSHVRLNAEGIARNR